MTDLPPHVEAAMPFRGECGMCGGPDARHRVLDAIAEQIRAGDDAESMSDDYALPLDVVQWIANEWTCPECDTEESA